MKYIRRLYNWVIGWGEHPSGGIALALVAFTESSVFIIPPDVLLIPLAFGKPKKAFVYAGICTACSVIGGIAGYFIGSALWSVVVTIISMLFAGNVASLCRISARGPAGRRGGHAASFRLGCRGLRTLTRSASAR